MPAAQTWHYGLIAEWWANFNIGGPEVESYGRFIEHAQPALDAGCGTGRLLLPWLRAGYDVDGCDVSPDMIALCREQARAEGFDPTLFVQPLHELQPPRRYRTIVVCGVFGIASTRGQDVEALRRLHAALEPDGTLLLDSEVPYSNARRWQRWHKSGRADLPTPWSTEADRKTTEDGTEYALWNRLLDLDPLDQTARMAIRAEKSRDGVVLGREERELTTRMWFRDELVQALRHAGFASVEVRGRDTGAAPAPDDDFLVYIGRP
jgi:SAM-dependent methyltransferase